MTLSPAQLEMLDVLADLVQKAGQPTPWQRGHLRALALHADGHDAQRVAALIAADGRDLPDGWWDTPAEWARRRGEMRARATETAESRPVAASARMFDQGINREGTT